MVSVLLETFILLLILLIAAMLLSHGAEAVAMRYGANFAGSVVLALVTTLPEYMFVFWAATKGEYAMAVGSAVGAATMLITLGYGLVIMTATSRTISRRPVEAIELTQETKIDAFYLVATALIALLLAVEGGGFDLKDGIILVLIFALYVYHITVGAVKFSDGHPIHGTRDDLYKGLILMALGGVITILVSERFVEAMLALSRQWEISPVAMAIVVGPIASELPEKLTAFMTVMRDGRLAEISVCNFIGSKVNHNSLLLGMLPLIAFYKGEGAVMGIVTPAFLAMTLLTLLAGASIARRRLERWQGWLFFALYAVPIYAALLAR